MSKLITKTKLSESVGWSESGGRRWVNQFKEYIPSVKKGSSVLYNDSSKKVLKIIKEMSDGGLSKKDIAEIIKQKGLPKNSQEASQIVIDRTSILNEIPLSRDIMFSILKIIGDGKVYTSGYITDELTKFFDLTEEQRNRPYQNGKDSIFVSRVRHARYSLKTSNYIEEINQSTFQITHEGLELLNDNKTEIKEEIEGLEEVIDPFEVIEERFEDITKELASSLIQKVKKAHWRKLEHIIVELLMAMGYGDGKITKKANDGGIDGVVKEDKLGLDNIYLQAKRYDNKVVGIEKVHGFSGAFDHFGAKKGVFITTSNFTAQAIEYAEGLQGKRIVLIDGDTLAKLMIKYNIGVENKETFIVKKVNFTYFEEE